MINLKGEVIGINTQRGISSGKQPGICDPHRYRSPGDSGIAWPRKKVTRSFIGITLKPLQDFENYYDIKGNQGVLIESVEKFRLRRRRDCSRRIFCWRSTGSP